MTSAKQNKILAVAEYLYLSYPEAKRLGHLSKARFVKLIYLVDWKASIELERQITPVEWHYNNYGPYVSDVIEVINASNWFVIQEDQTAAGNFKEIVHSEQNRMDEELEAFLDQNERSVIQQVIANTQDLSFNDFVHLVYSTYPIIKMNRGDALDLPAFAKEYLNIRAQAQAQKRALA
jgi:hypothetical protein